MDEDIKIERDARDAFGVRCVFCGDTQPSVYAAVESGWIPGFDDADGKQIDGPTCLDCQREHIDSTDYADVLKPGHEAAIKHS